MTPLVGLLVIVLAAAAIIGLFAGLERWLRKPGLAFIFTAISGVIIAGVGIADGKRLIPVLFLVQVPGFVYFAHLRRTEARTESAETPEA